MDPEKEKLIELLIEDFKTMIPNVLESTVRELRSRLERMDLTDLQLLVTGLGND